MVKILHEKEVSILSMSAPTLVYIRQTADSYQGYGVEIVIGISAIGMFSFGHEEADRELADQTYTYYTEKISACTTSEDLRELVATSVDPIFCVYEPLFDHNQRDRERLETLVVPCGVF